MLKNLTFSVGLAVALGMSSLSFAGGHGKTLPTAQAVAAPQSYIAPRAQCETPSPQCDTGCDTGCGIGHGFKLPKCNFKMPTLPKCDILGKLKPKPKCYTYEWVLKKKKVGHGLFGGGCGDSSCTGGCGDVVAPSAQWPSSQAYGSGQATGSGQMYGSGQAMGSGQATVAPAAAVEAAPDAAPPVSANPPTASNGGLLFLAPAGN